MSIIIKKLITIIAILLFSHFLANKHNYLRLMMRCPAKFIENSNIYYASAETEDDRLYVLLYTARAYYELRDNENSVVYLKKLENELASQHFRPLLSIKFYGNLAFSYTLMGYKYKAKIMIRKGEECLGKITSKAMRHEGSAFQNFYNALVTSKNKDTAQALQLYKMADKEYNLLSRINPDANPELGHMIAVNIGDAYMDRNLLEKAIEYNKLALQRLNHKDVSGAALLNLAIIYSQKKAEDSALYYYIKGAEITEDTEYLSETFDSIISIYQRRKDTQKVKYYSALQNKVLKGLEKVEASGFQNLQNKQPENFPSWIVYSIIYIIILLGIFYLYTKRGTIENKKKPPVPNKPQKSIEKTSVNKEIEKQITDDLALKIENYEKSEHYLRSDLTLAKVAVYLETNPQVLSDFINRYKQVNFTMYINSLRIEYICKLLRDDKKYRSYKIAYLANVSGFLSHSTFTKIFKNVKGISPSQYIEMLDASPDDGSTSFPD